MNTTQNTQTAPTPDKANAPDWVVKTAKGYGRKQRLERIGVAWSREDGGICLRLSGTQIIGDDVYIYPMTPDASE